MGHIWQIEDRDGGIDVKTAAKIAGVFGVSVDFLISNGNEPLPSAEELKKAIEEAQAKQTEDDVKTPKRRRRKRAA